MLLPGSVDQATYLLARCGKSATPSAVVERLRTHSDLSAFTKEEFSRRTRVHWLTQTNAGVSTAFTAALGLLVGAVITSQSLYAAVAASMREYAVLRALGIPRRRIIAVVLVLSFWVGMAGRAIDQSSVLNAPEFFHSISQAARLHRLQQVVQCIYFEGLQCIFVIRGGCWLRLCS